MADVCGSADVPRAPRHVTRVGGGASSLCTCDRGRVAAVGDCRAAIRRSRPRKRVAAIGPKAARRETTQLLAGAARLIAKVASAAYEDADLVCRNVSWSHKTNSILITIFVKHYGMHNLSQENWMRCSRAVSHQTQRPIWNAAIPLDFKMGKIQCGGRSSLTAGLNAGAYCLRASLPHPSKSEIECQPNRRFASGQLLEPPSVAQAAVRLRFARWLF